MIPAGTHVEIRWTILEAPDRAPGLPADTAVLPYEARVRGALATDARRGGPGTVRTASGRVMSGTVSAISPAHEHDFGRPQAALQRAIDAITGLRKEP
jgi:2-amino-4-ketopentanoate thiolase alpha subunit